MHRFHLGLRSAPLGLNAPTAVKITLLCVLVDAVIGGFRRGRDFERTKLWAKNSTIIGG